MQKHVFLTFIGVLLSIPLVAWIQPENSGGTAFVVVMSLSTVNLVGAAMFWMFRSRESRPKETMPSPAPEHNVPRTERS